MARFKSTGSVSWHGVEFKPDADGEVVVPNEAVGELQSHGLVLVEGSFAEVPMPSEALTAAAQLRQQLEEALAKVRALTEENGILQRDVRQKDARIRELEAMSGPEVDEKSNTDANAPKFGAMTVEQMEAFAAEHKLDVDLSKGSIPVKRSALKSAFEALQRRLSGN